MIQYWRQAMRMGAFKLRLLSVGKTKEDQALFNRLFTSLAKEANKRLERLEKNDYTYYAYELAMDYITHVNPPLSSNRYMWDPSSMEANYETLMSMRTFVSKRTSTLTGQRAVERQRLAAFRELLNLSDNPRQKGYVTNRELRNFLDVLGNQPIRNTLSEVGKGMSGELVELLFGHVQANNGLKKEILDAFEFYRYSESHPEDFISKKARLTYTELVDYLKTGVIDKEIDLDALRRENKIK